MVLRSPADIRVAHTPGADQPIPRSGAQITGFIGRTLRGPLNQPVIVRSYAEFQQHFGGLWQPSPLSYAVEHFFEQGGRQAAIVRVANGASPATVSLRCGEERLQLEACAPGTREFLRACVDYDHVDAADERSFNLVVQRVRSPGSERIETQETFRAVSVDPQSQRYVAAALLQSRLVRVHGPTPPRRPERTMAPGANAPVGYVSSNPDGDDGLAVTDYDVIGSAVRRTGLFALEDVDDLAFVYIPPLSRVQDVGASALLAAARFCRRKRALLIVDPPAPWDSAVAAARGVREMNFHSEDCVMFYPRIAAMDRLRGRVETFGNGGAVAGLLSRSEAAPAALSAREPEPLLRPGARLAHDVGSGDRWMLTAHGVNVLQPVRSPAGVRAEMRTLACGASAASDWSYLARRRFALYVINAIERGTRWCAPLAADVNTWPRVTRQTREFLAELRDAGAFSAASPEEPFNVICDERINLSGEQPPAVNILVQFAGSHPGEQHSFMITHSLRGSTVKQVAANRVQEPVIGGDSVSPAFE